ncbi:MAG: DUF433 domain-containing protein [Candidatus Tectimicrobiota bacterium]
MEESPYVEYRDSVYRVVGTRVALDTLVWRFWEGESPEAIVQSFPMLTLEQIYGAIAYYLHHQACIDTYLQQSRAEEAAVVEQLRHQNRALHERLVHLKSKPVQTHAS